MKRFGFLAIFSVLLLTGCGGPQNSGSTDGAYDVDLTVLDSNMVFAQVSDMYNNPDSYVGKTVKASGTFGYYQNPDTQTEYFAVLIQDATACCAQGIEFLLKGNPKYPADYPEPQTEITVTGVFNYYEELGNTYCQLKEATLETA